MKILKFGGSSIGNAERIQRLKQFVCDGTPKIVVLSAMQGTTDKLEAIANYLYQRNWESAREEVNTLKKHYTQAQQQLFDTEAYRQKAQALIQSQLDQVLSFTRDVFTVYEERAVLAQGELLTTALVQLYMEASGCETALLPALNFMRIDKDGEPDSFYIRENLDREMKAYPENMTFITQGYICRNAYGEIDNLKRGGSDYTASIIGAELKADEIQIWTDIDGMHNNDPRYVERTKPIEQLSFEEAAELSYFGAKILHPTSILPAKLADIPVWLKNTLKPEAAGTRISHQSKREGVKAIAAKDDITAIQVISGRMLMAHGFLRKIFEIFEAYRTPIDMIATSEVSVSATIDDTSHLDEIRKELQRYGTVQVMENQTIICIVGDFIAESKGHAARIFQTLSDIPLHMISYGGSQHNISALVSGRDKQAALSALNRLFDI